MLASVQSLQQSGQSLETAAGGDVERVRSHSVASTWDHNYHTRSNALYLYHSIVQDSRPLPPVAATPEEDDELFVLDPWVEPPLRIDYGTNVTLGDNVFLNFNCVILDTCQVTIGARTLVGPDVKFYSGTHPLDPVIRNGTNGPELGKEIHVGEDVWIGGTVTIL